MTRAQTLGVVILTLLVCIVFAIAATMAAQSDILSSGASIAQQPDAGQPDAAPLATPTATGTPTPSPTSTLVPTPTETPLPTPTNTRVVLDTPTGTALPTGTPTPVESTTPTSSASNGYTSTPRPTPTPTSRYPLRVVDGPVDKKTKNHMFVVYARITGPDGTTLLPDYRMIGTHSPTGVNIQSEPSCDYLCRASGPRMEDYYILEGNLVFEAFFYDTGTWSLVVLDPQGQQASEKLEIEIDRQERRWFYYHLSQ